MEAGFSQIQSHILIRKQVYSKLKNVAIYLTPASIGYYIDALIAQIYVAKCKHYLLPHFPMSFVKFNIFVILIVVIKLFCILCTF